LRLDLSNDTADLLRRFRDRVRELADLLGDHGKTLARIAGARGLDGGVQREDLRLLGDVVDDDENPADLLAALPECENAIRRGLGGLADLLDAVSRVGDSLHAFLSARQGALSDACHRSGVLRDLLGCLSEFLNRRRCLGDGRRLLRGTRGVLLGGGQDL